MIKDEFKPINPIEPAKPRGEFRKAKTEKIKKVTEKLDFNFPKTLLGIVLIGAGIGCNYVSFLGFMSDWLLNAGIGLVIVGVGMKINRKSRGGKIFQNEINIIKSLLKKGN